MKKKIIALVLAAVLLAGALALVSCKKKVPEVEYTTVTRITFDAIASVEIIVNFQNNVVAVTPYNDAAEIILTGESFLKTTPDETVAKIAALAANAGYFAAVDSLKIFGKYVRNLHAKDGKYPTNGHDLGSETKIGEGDVDFPAVFKKLHELGYDSFVTIENELSGGEQLKDILNSRDYLQSLIDEIYA